MRLDKFLANATKTLSDASIGTARLDALVLLEDTLHKDRAHLLAHPEIELTSEQINELTEQITRRSQHLPLAYIRGKTEFYGREFTVNENVLEPRPESETMINLVKKLVQGHPKTSIADIGSGSGCLGITAALELGLQQADFYDIDPTTFKVAKANAERYKVHGQFYESDLLSDAHGPYDIILANLPYVPDSFHINQAAMREPGIAIFGGQDGLDLYRKLFAQLETTPWKPRYILTEALPPQHNDLRTTAVQHGFSLMESDDFIQAFVPV